jgi:hypothetical protein
MWPLARWIFVACCLGAFVSWFAIIPPFVAVARELKRARDAGEVNNIFGVTGGLPLVVIFTDVLPRARKDRIKLMRALAAFLGCLLMGAVVMALFGPPHN